MEISLAGLTKGTTFASFTPPILNSIKGNGRIIDEKSHSLSSTETIPSFTVQPKASVGDVGSFLSPADTLISVGDGLNYN